MCNYIYGYNFSDPCVQAVASSKYVADLVAVLPALLTDALPRCVTDSIIIHYSVIVIIIVSVFILFLIVTCSNLLEPCTYIPAA